MEIELTDFNTKEVVDTLEVDAVLVATGRAPYTQVRQGQGAGVVREVQGAGVVTSSAAAGQAPL